MNQRSPRRTLLWFRRQLRLHDQPLFDAIDPATDQVAGVFILDPRDHLVEVDGRPRTGPHRMRFLLESVADLRASLARRGVDLLVRVGEPESILPGLATELSIDRLCLVEEPGTEERTVERAVQAALGPKVLALPVETLLELDDPRAFARDLPEVFSKFRRHAEKRLQIAPPRPGPASLNGLERPGDVALGELPTLAGCSIEESAPDTHLCHRVEIIPVEVVVRNVAAGSLTKRFGVTEGQVLERPLVEFFYKSDELALLHHAPQGGVPKRWFQLPARVIGCMDE